MKSYCLYVCSLLLILTGCKPQNNNSGKLANFNVNAGNYERIETTVSYDLDDITSVAESELILYETTGNKKTPVSFQVSSLDRRYIYWQLTGNTLPDKVRKYELRKEKNVQEKPNVNIRQVKTGYEITHGGKSVLTYNSETVYPPEGIDTAFKRSGFIHPLNAPNGAVLTAIQPDDHYHHYGIWNPWTKTRFRDEEVDFWNLAKLQGTVRNAGIISLNEGNVFGSIVALHEHIAWPESDKETRAMSELHEIKVYNRTDGIYVIDINTAISPMEPITFEEYRYGGFGYRATGYWTRHNTEFFTSEGKSRDDADGERAKWFVLNGETQKGTAGILIMGHPSNFNHPEPLRVWPSNSVKDRGDFFINFSPTRNTDWILEPGNTYLLSYRLLVSDGKIDILQAEKAWNDFESPPVVRLEK